MSTVHCAQGQLRVDTVEKGFMRVAPPAPLRKGFLNHRLGCNYEPSTARDRNWILSDHISSVIRSTFSTASVKCHLAFGLLRPSTVSAAPSISAMPAIDLGRAFECRDRTFSEVPRPA